MTDILYGHNPHSKIVAVHPTEDNKMRVYARDEKQVTFEDIDFFPFFSISENYLLTNFHRRHWVKRLEGKNYFEHIVAFSRWFDMWVYIHNLLNNHNQQTGKNLSSFTDLPFLHLIPDQITQFLIQSGRTFFKEMDFEDVHRMQISIETFKKPGTRLSNANRSDDRILYIALTDNKGWEKIIGKKEKSEKEVIGLLIEIIRDRNPDVIEGHYLHNYILPYILKRCELMECEFNIGRDDKSPTVRENLLYQQDFQQDSKKYEINGRNFVDSVSLLHNFDASGKILHSYNLKYVSDFFGYLSITNQPDEAISDAEYADPVAECLENAKRLGFLTGLLLPNYFKQVQIFPYKLDSLIDTGSAAKIEMLLIREYVHHKYSIPKPQSQKQISGGHTDIFLRGVIGPVLYADVESMYPTIIIKQNIAPASDVLNVFNTTLQELTKIRLEYKNKFQEDKNNQLLYHIQRDFKQLINSYYGYLAYHRGLFNDYDKAEKVSETGKDILKNVIEIIQSRGGKIIEVDTDGIYFIPPEHITDESGEEKFFQRMKDDIPPEYNLILDSRYKKMLSYKKKNYATLDYENKIQIKGSALISKNIERFGINLIQQCIERILNHDFTGLHIFYVNLFQDIANRRWQVQDFMRIETLKESLSRYKKEVDAEKRNRSAVYELALKSESKYKIGDRIAYYITGTDTNVTSYENCKVADKWDPNFPDENTSYYLKRLEEQTKKFKPFFDEHDFNLIFSLEESLEDLNNIVKSKIIEVSEEKEQEDGEITKDTSAEDVGIWLAND
ncbi:MAG: DNA polymerase domain-containing protein [Bacteroidota bacterium]|nr:DNA polymerase domain-containing protein [Bacteroidota bacterium]